MARSFLSQAVMAVLCLRSVSIGAVLFSRFMERSLSGWRRMIPKSPLTVLLAKIIWKIKKYHHFFISVPIYAANMQPIVNLGYFSLNSCIGEIKTKLGHMKAFIPVKKKILAPKSEARPLLTCFVGIIQRMILGVILLIVSVCDSFMQQ